MNLQPAELPGITNSYVEHLDYKLLIFKLCFIFEKNKLNYINSKDDLDKWSNLTEEDNDDKKRKSR